MNWLAFALCGPVLWAISTHLDKYLVERYFKDTNVIVLLVFTALMGLVLMPIIAIFDATAVFQRDGLSIALMTLSGMSLHGWNHLLSARPAGPRSVGGRAVLPVVAAVRLHPGFFVLGETAERHSARRRRADHRWRAAGLDRHRAATRAIPLAARRADADLRLCDVACDADLQGVRHQGRVLGDHVLDVRRRGLVRFWLSLHRVFSARVRAASAQSTAAALLAINASNELINLGGGLANRYALMFAPMAIVQAIGSTTTLFVFVIGVALTLLFPGISRETLAPRDLAQKGLAAALVAAGIALVSR